MLTRATIQIGGFAAGLLGGWIVAVGAADVFGSFLLAWTVAVAIWVSTARALYLVTVKGSGAQWPPYIGLLWGMTLGAGAAAVLLPLASSLDFGGHAT